MTSQPFYDAPGGIRREGNDQTLTFTRTSATTGTICWSPVPPNGQCAPSGNYAGGVLVGSTSPIGQSEKPKDGTCCYTGDPTMSPQLFAGDVLGNAKVLWSNNVDVVTSCVDITGLDGNCSAYYFAFFAIDNTCRYNQDGVYSYSQSLSTTVVSCTQGSQCIQMNGARPTDVLNLLTPGGDGIDPATKTYPVTIALDGKLMNLTLRGSKLSTYQSLVDEFSTAWQRIGTQVVESDFPPNYGNIYTANGSWYQFDGAVARQIFPSLTSTDPHAPAIDAAWVNPTSNTIKFWNGAAWEARLPLITYPRDPTIVECDQYWYNGTTVNQYDGIAWLPRSSHVQPTDPATAPTLTCQTFWNNNSVFSRWNDTTGSWNQLQVTHLASDPLHLPNGIYWFNPMTLSLQMWNGLVWVNQVFANSTVQPTSLAANALWFDPSTNTLSKYDSIAAVWNPVTVLVFFKPVNNVQAGDFWYNTATNVLSEYASSTGWIDVSSTTFTSPTDPAKPPLVDDGTLWKNTSTGIWFSRSGMQWVGVNVVECSELPASIATGYWYNPTTATWYRRQGTAWGTITPTYNTAYDPTILQLGATWFNGTALYQQTTLTNWTAIPFSTTPVTVLVGQRWLNTVTGVVSQWSGSQWVEQIPPYTVAFNAKNDILLSSTMCGEPSWIEVINAPILQSILHLIISDPVAGLDGKSGTPMYAEVGVGTDGSVDERRAIIDNLYTRLGYPIINVELTRAQMDLAVQKGLDYMRRDSGAGYNRGYFFLDLLPGQQHYTLTSKAVGFNKIVDVLFLYRPRGGFLNSTFGGEIYGQQMLQQLYVSGTFDILTYHLLAGYQNVVAKMFASELQFQWSERTRVLAIQRKIARTERILVDAVIERTEQDLLTDRITKNWVENWALTEAKIMLGEMRGKYTSLPGAGGAISMNGDALKSEAVATQALLKTELDDFLASDVETWGIGASITRG